LHYEMWPKPDWAYRGSRVPPALTVRAFIERFQRKGIQLLPPSMRYSKYWVLKPIFVLLRFGAAIPSAP
jgi:hypothetical protein